MIASTLSGFFHSTTWNVVRDFALLMVVVFWAATVYWVYQDARRRIGDPILVWVSTAVGVFPFLGPMVYMLFRPPEFLEDVRERDLEMRAFEERLASRDHRCPVCRAAIEEDFLVCPVCTTRVRQPCKSCSRPLESAWQVCPYCETPIETAEGEKKEKDPAPAAETS
ncbi:MAG TPA: zinc ribbon domain-containing protein [Gaiellaceae bacterium]